MAIVMNERPGKMPAPGSLAKHSR